MLVSPYFFLKCVLPKNIPISDEITILLAEFHWFLKSVLISDYVHLYDSYSQQTFFKARSPLLHLLSPARSPNVKGCLWSQRPMHWQMERNIVPCYLNKFVQHCKMLCYFSSDSSGLSLTFDILWPSTSSMSGKGIGKSDAHPKTSSIRSQYEFIYISVNISWIYPS